MPLQFVETLLGLCSSGVLTRECGCFTTYGLVAIPSDQLRPSTVATRRYETHYMQIRCNSCMYSQTTVSQTFFPSAVRLWNRLPPESRHLLSHPTASSQNSRRSTWCDDARAPSFYLTVLHDFTFLVLMLTFYFGRRSSAHNSAALAARYYSILSWRLYLKMKKQP